MIKAFCLMINDLSFLLETLSYDGVRKAVQTKIYERVLRYYFIHSKRSAENRA